MSDLYPIRPIRDDEFEMFARVVANTYGGDWRDADTANERAFVELDRTLAAFDSDSPIPIIGGAAIYPRTMTLPGLVQQPIAGITWVGVSPTHRRRGILTSLMRRQLTDLHESGGEPIAVLNAAEATIYGRFGYGISSRAVWLQGEKRSMQFWPDIDVGRGTIRLLSREAARPPMEQVYDTVRVASVGWTDRPRPYWDASLSDDEHGRGGATALRYAVHAEPDGAITGYALYRLKEGGKDGSGEGRIERSGTALNTSTVQVIEMAATTRQAYAAAWQFLIGIDLHPRISYEGARDEPLLDMLQDVRAVRPIMVDRLWVRLVDVDRALVARRYATPLDVIFEVEDIFCPWNAGRYRLHADGVAVTCERTQARADLRLSATELGAAFLGGTTLASLAAAGRVTELHPGAVARCSVAFRGIREPFYPGGAAFPGY